jgi:UDP-2,3-diacylglucosamine hydrolase
MSTQQQRIGLIAGNGKFPLLVLDAARSKGMQVVVAAIREETFPEIEQHGASAVYWLSLGELSKLIETFKRENITRAIMAGQVKHRQIFSSIKPDWRLAKLLLSLTTRNTDSLIGAVSKVLADEGITLMNSTELLEPMLATPRACSRNARRAIPSERTSPTGTPLPIICRASTSARPWSLPRRRASRWKRWKGPTRPSCAPAKS